MTVRGGFRIGGRRVAPGETRDVSLPVSETYGGRLVMLRVRVMRARRDGPAVFVTAGVHGDEWNGVGIVRELLRRPPRLRAGTLVCVPVVNVFGFERHARTLPDRRDLNRVFPGSAEGNLAERLACTVFDEIVRRCDFGIELHTAPVRRTNFPNVRGDLDDAGVMRLARAFGCRLILHKKGAPGSLRRVATEDGRPTILLEAGEPLKFETGMIETGVRGVRGVLRELGMTAGPAGGVSRPIIARRSVWVRASRGGLLRFAVASGERVRKGGELARVEDLFGRELERLRSPTAGVVAGMTTLPAVKPGEPVCHLAIAEDRDD